VIRLASLLVLVALAAAVTLAVDTTGPNAILFVFVGVPLLLLGVALYGFQRWRAGAFQAPPPRN